MVVTTPEILTILGVGIVLAAVLVASAQRTDKQLDRLEGLLDGLREALFERAACV